MVTKTLLLAGFMLTVLPGAAYAGCTGAICGAAGGDYAPVAGTTNTSSSTANTTLNKSDEKFLSTMPNTEFPGAAYMADNDHDGIADGEQKHDAKGNPITGTSSLPVMPGMAATSVPQKTQTKYVYKPGSATTLRRAIQDDRIEDGYVQGYMNQGPGQ